MGYISLSARFDKPAEKSSVNFDSAKVNDPAQKINIGEVLSLVVKDSIVYFVSTKALFSYNTVTDGLSYVNLSKLGLKNVLKVFLVGKKVILGDNNSGLYEYMDGKIAELPGAQFFKGKRCLMILPYDDKHALVATYTDGLFLYNYVSGEVSADFVDPALQKTLCESRIYSGTIL